MRLPRLSVALTIADLLWPEFAAVGECVFLKDVASAGMDLRFPTQTEFFENHVHLLDHFTHGAGLEEEPCYDANHPDFQAAFALGRRVCRLWALKLRQDFPHWHFRVYLHGFDPIVRFHRVRAEEPPAMSDEYIAQHQQDGLPMVVDTRTLVA